VSNVSATLSSKWGLAFPQFGQQIEINRFMSIGIFDGGEALFVRAARGGSKP
jgi:hypothetical protein